MSEAEKKELYDIVDAKSLIRYRAKIVLLAGEGYTVPEIMEMTNIYDKTIRKWIHRFNDNGVHGLFTEIDYSGMVKINDKMRKEIIQTSSTNSRERTWFEILYLVIEIYSRLCKRKGDSERRWHKSYYYKRYSNRMWRRVEALKDYSW